MEDISLALADETVVYGPRSSSTAREGRLPEAPPPVVAPRRVADSVVDEIAAAANRRVEDSSPVRFFLYEPQQPSSGVLTSLDAVALLGSRGMRLELPMVSSGPGMTFAPSNKRVARRTD